MSDGGVMSVMIMVMIMVESSGGGNNGGGGGYHVSAAPLWSVLATVVTVGDDGLGAAGLVWAGGHRRGGLLCGYGAPRIVDGNEWKPRVGIWRVGGGLRGMVE